MRRPALAALAALSLAPLGPLTLSGCYRPIRPITGPSLPTAESGVEPGLGRPATRGTPAEAEGLVSSPVHGRVFTLETPDARLRLRTTPSTRVTLQGREVGLAELREGDEVRASYTDQGGRPVAEQVEILRRAR